MTKNKHCELCVHANRNLKTGILCGLTLRKPDFESFCPYINFSDFSNQYSIELLDKIEVLKKKKPYVFLNFILLEGIGFITMFWSYPHIIEGFKNTFINEFNYSQWKYFSVYLILLFVSTLLIWMGIWSVNKFRKQQKRLKTDKKKINLILSNYKMNINELVRLK